MGSATARVARSSALGYSRFALRREGARDDRDRGNREAKAASNAHFTHHPQPTAVRLDDSLRDRETKADAAPIGRPRLPIFVEQARLIRRRYPGSVIGDLEDG